MSKYQRVTLIFLICLTSFPLLVYPQYWKKPYYEGIYGLGASNLMSDVGSPDADLTGYFKENFWLTPQVFRPIILIGGRYNFNPRMSIRVNIAFANLAAADIYGGYRSENRITNTFLIELSGQYEYFVIKEKPKKNVYRLSTYKRYKNLNVPTYFFIGLGGSVFFSKTQVNERYIGNQSFVDGQKVDYKDSFERPEKYTLITPVIPFGLGIKIRMNKVIRFGIEAGYHLTFTDNLDEVKIIKEETGNWWPDTYQFLLFTLNYKLKTGRSGLPQFRFK